MNLITLMVIDLGGTVVLVVLGTIIGYRLGKRRARAVAAAVLGRLRLDEDPHPDHPLAVFPSPLAEVLAELDGRPASAHRIQEEIDNEARIRLGETWRTSRTRRA